MGLRATIEASKHRLQALVSGIRRFDRHNLDLHQAGWQSEGQGFESPSSTRLMFDGAESFGALCRFVRSRAGIGLAFPSRR